MEQWKEISGYEGCYEVSNYGNVRSIPHKVNTKGGKQRNSPGCMMKQKTTRNGYKQIGLSQNGKNKWIGVHRLVAEAFVPNPEGLPQVNHKDEKKTNNYADNLEWVTASDNCKYGHRNDTMIEQTSRKVERLMGNVIVTYNSIRSAAEMTGVSASHICQCCKGERKTAGGTQWRYAIEIAEKHPDLTSTEIKVNFDRNES